jgi:hypothetical protein
MFNRKFQLKPQNFLIMVLGGIAGIFLVYRGLVIKNNDPIILGGLLVVVSLVMFATQFVKIPGVGVKVEEEIAKLFPPQAKKQVLTLLTNGFTGYNADGVHLSMLKFSKGSIDRLKKLSRALNHQSDFRDAYPKLEYMNKQLDENETK